MLRRHPSKRALFAFAENSVDRAAPVDAALAAHLNQCPDCAAEVRAMRASLAFLQETPALEPSRELTQQILAAARKERSVRRAAPSARSAALAAVKGVACAGALAAAGLVIFAVALQEEAAAPAAPAASLSSAPAETGAPSPEAIRRAAAEIRTLSAAVRPKEGDAAHTPHEFVHRRTATAVEADLAAAAAALERNPGSVRASHIFNDNLPRQAEILRALYVERAL